MSSTIYLISGANRGIGLALATNILKKHDHAFVYAGARDPNNAVALNTLGEKYPGRLAIIKCVSADIEGNTELAREIKQKHGRVDTVVANSAISESHGTVADTSLSSMEEHFWINVLGPLALFQATYNLLKASKNPRFITITSGVGSVGGPLVSNPNIGMTPYGSSKAALNWVTRKIHFENEWLIAFPLTPGPVKTDMFLDNTSKEKEDETSFWMKMASTAEEATREMLEVIDKSTREENGGQFCTKHHGDRGVW